MDKKKAIKLATASAVAASAFVAANPHASEAAVNVDAVVKQAKASFTAVYNSYKSVASTGELVDKAKVQAAVTKADKAYANAVATVKKSGGKKKDAYLADLEKTYKQYVVNGGKNYVKAYDTLVQLEQLHAALEDAVAKKDLAKVESNYHKLSAVLKKVEGLVKSIYGAGVRAALLENVGAAKTTKDGLIYDVTVYMKLNAADAAVKADKLADAEKALADAEKWLAQAAQLKAELTALQTTVKAAYEAKATPKVVSVSAINKKTVKVTLNKEVSDIKLANVKVALKDNNADLYLEKVEVSGKEVTITTGDTLTAGKTYVVSVKDLAPVETTYNVAPAAKVEVVKTVVSNTANTKLETKVYDKDGNDITPDYTVKFESADTSHVDADGNVTVAGFPTSGVIVKPYVVVGNEKVYGAQVTIKTAAVAATTFEGFTIVDDDNGAGTASAAKFADIDPKNVKTSIKIGEAATGNWYIAPYVLDQFGQKFSSDSIAYKYESLDPTVLVVESSTGKITPIAAGTARVKITSGDFSKVITVEVKAASELKELAVSKDSVSLSDKAPAQSITVTAKDQYGDTFSVTGVTIEENDPNGVVTVSSTTVDSGSSFTITPVAGKEGTATITLKKGTVTKTINVTVTKADSTVAGYKAVIASDSVSKDFEIDKAKTSGTDQDNTVKLELYAVDANGNIVSSTPVNATWKVKDYTNGFVTISNDTTGTADGITDTAVANVTVTAAKAGTVTLVPTVGGLELSPVTITVKDSTVNLASVAAKRTAVNVNESAGDAWSTVLGNLEGTGTDGKAKSVTAADIKAVYSSDTSVVANANLSGSPTMTVSKAGRTTVTVVFKDELKLNPVAFTLNVVDDVAPTVTASKFTAVDNATGTEDKLQGAAGAVGEAGATVKAYQWNDANSNNIVDAGELGSAINLGTSAADGSVTAANIGDLAANTYKFVITATDAAGNESAKTAAAAVTITLSN